MQYYLKYNKIGWEMCFGKCGIRCKPTKNILVVNKKARQKNDRLLEYFIKKINAPLSS